MAHPILSERRLGLIIEELLSKSKDGARMSPLGIATASTECEPVSPLGWLASAKTYPRIYWASRDGQFEVAGCGSVWSIAEDDSDSISERLTEIKELLGRESADELQYVVGGICFDPAASRDSLWAGFPALWFVLPKVALVREGGDYRIVVSSTTDHPPDHHGIREHLQIIDSALESSELVDRIHPPEILDRTDKPDRAGWLRMVEQGIGAIDKQTLDKVVLARRSDLRLSGSFDPVAFLAELKEANSGCYGMMLEPRPSTAFVSASPERLFKLTGTTLRSEAVAGTIARSDDTGSTDEQLLSSAKDRVEQRYVVDGLSDNLRDLSQSLNVDEQPEILRLPKVLHLRSRISAELKPGVGFADILSALHPTAAVCGLPRHKAHDLIRILEPFDRGWYAGAVGCIGHDTSEFAVAIRSALIRGQSVSLFAGAGIVAQSNPDAEWQELEHKLATALQPLSGVRV